MANLLGQQRALQRDVFGIDPAALEGGALSAYANFNALAVGREVGEAFDHLPGWKWHSHAEPHVEDREAYVGELADALRHLFNLFLIAGVTERELEEFFEAKESVIRRREESGEYVG